MRPVAADAATRWPQGIIASTDESARMAAGDLACQGRGEVGGLHLGRDHMTAEGGRLLRG